MKIGIRVSITRDLSTGKQMEGHSPLTISPIGCFIWSISSRYAPRTSNPLRLFVLAASRSMDYQMRTLPIAD